MRVQILLVGEGLVVNPLVAVVIKLDISLEKEAWQLLLYVVTFVKTELLAKFVQVAGVKPQV